jgi:hypothetical protein
MHMYCTGTRKKGRVDYKIKFPAHPLEWPMGWLLESGLMPRPSTYYTPFREKKVFPANGARNRFDVHG